MSFAFKFIALVSLATFVVSQVPNCARNYTVVPGDVCNSISAAHNVSTFQLAHVNAGKIDAACDNLAVGESLCLGIIGQDCNITTVVNLGDTCQTVATKAGISTTLLLRNNPNINKSTCANIIAGQVMCTAKKVFVV
ncbi:hypothetical protein JB92DRAFT_2921244 [Gautieria morchelliformis]|nr:hypothetical protein JB92DRAFT_2921244 [Gautieria morchelliformis]